MEIATPLTPIRYFKYSNIHPAVLSFYFRHTVNIATHGGTALLEQLYIQITELMLSNTIELNSSVITQNMVTRRYVLNYNYIYEFTAFFLKEREVRSLQKPSGGQNVAKQKLRNICTFPYKITKLDFYLSIRLVIQ